MPSKEFSAVEETGATVIQLWEGRVLTADFKSGVMQVLLCAKMGVVPDHTAEIELQWVSEQDLDLVRPGAVFYLTLYKQSRKRTVTNAQELRFRRRPTWSKQQIRQIWSDANTLATKMQARPIAK